MNYDPIASDPVTYDEDYPADMISLRVEAEPGVFLYGVALVAQGAGPHPTMALLHGFPGNEKNFDLAQTFRRAGWNVVIFHYRGSWGSGGTFSFGHVLEDVATMLTYLRSEQARSLCRVDSTRLILVGHSMGGWAALMTAARDSGVQAVASIAGWNLGQDASTKMKGNTAEFAFYWGEEARVLQGTSGEKLVAEVQAHAEEWNLLGCARKLVNRPVLSVAGSQDTVLPPAEHHTPLVQALTQAGASQFNEVTLESEHGFNDRRVALARVLLAWLSGLSIGPA